MSCNVILQTVCLKNHGPARTGKGEMHAALGLHLVTGAGKVIGKCKMIKGAAQETIGTKGMR